MSESTLLLRNVRVRASGVGRPSPAQLSPPRLGGPPRGLPDLPILCPGLSHGTHWDPAAPQGDPQ
jgi:hypothetical protein